MKSLSAERWERAHIVVMAVFGLLGAVLMLLPWLNDAYHWRAELSLISPVWGSLLLISRSDFGVNQGKRCTGFGSLCLYGLGCRINNGFRRLF